MKSLLYGIVNSVELGSRDRGASVGDISISTLSLVALVDELRRRAGGDGSRWRPREYESDNQPEFDLRETVSG